MKNEDFRLWGLCSFGVYPKSIISLLDLNISLDDLMDKNSVKIARIKEKKSSLLDIVLPLIDDPKIQRNLKNVTSVYVLYRYEAPLETLKLLDKVNINYTNLVVLPLPENYYDFGIDEKSAVRLLECFEKSRVFFSNVLDVSQKQFYLISSEIINLLKQNSSMTSVKISYLLSKIGLASEEEIYKVLRLMKSRKDIEQCPEGISLPRSHVARYINSLDDKTKVFFNLFSKGKSIHEIVNLLELTNIELSKITTTLRNRIQKFPEDRYKPIFEKYFIQRNDFKFLFDVDDDFYTLFSIELEVGKLPLKEILKSEILTSEQKQKIYSGTLETEKTYEFSPEIIPILEYVLKRKYINPTRISELYDDYHNEIKEKYIAFSKRLDLTLNSFEKILSKFPNIIYPSHSDIRFYFYNRDFSPIIDLIKIHLEKNYLISFVEFFEVNISLMRKLNISNYYELTQIFRYLGITKLFNLFEYDCYLGPIDFDFNVFLLNYLHLNSPISEVKFVEMICRKYGKNKKEIAQFIRKSDQIEIEKGLILSHLQIFDRINKEVEQELIDHHFVSLMKFKKITQKILGFYDESALNVVNFYKLNLRYQDGILYNSMFADVYECIDDFLDNQHLINMGEIDVKLQNHSYFKKRFTSCLNEFDILQYSDNEYISIKKLIEVNIDKNMINGFLDQIKADAKDLDFFSFSNLKVLNENILIHITGFDETFVRNIILKCKDINYIQYYGKYIFSYKAREFTIRDVFLSFLKERQAIDVDDFIDEIRRNYDIIVTRARMKSILENTSLYINDTMDRIYSDKKHYLKEVEFYYGY